MRPEGWRAISPASWSSHPEMGCTDAPRALPDGKGGWAGGWGEAARPADPSGAGSPPAQVLGGLGSPPPPSLLGAQSPPPHPTPPEQVLLSLSDEDLELGLGVCSSLHRRKLRLAIEDYRDAEAGRR